MKNEEFRTITEVRGQAIDGVRDWTWPIVDTGAWDGPMHDWPQFRAVYEKMHPRRTVVQAGGNCGMYPRLLSALFDRVYTFEPDSLNFHCLVNNCQSNRIFKINAALGERQGFVSLQRPSMGNMGTHRVDPLSVSEGIPMFAIDQFGFDDVDLIALDTEGYEENVLRGAVETITRHRPVIQAENGDRSKLGPILEPLGYEPFAVEKADHFWRPIEKQ